MTTQETTVPVLDQGYVRLVDSMGSDVSVVRAARVSYDGDGDWRSAADEKLIRYLLRNRHTSPFEHVVFTFEVEAPIFVFRQWHRHRTWSFNEISARYAELDMGAFAPIEETITTQSSSNKQMRTDEPNPNADLIRQLINDHNHESVALYRTLLARDCPRELARVVLPVSTYSRMYATIDLHNLLHFLGLRLHAHAQHEIRVYARAMLQLIRPIVPVTIAAWEELQKEEEA